MFMTVRTTIGCFCLVSSLTVAIIQLATAGGLAPHPRPLPQYHILVAAAASPTTVGQRAD